MDRPAIVMHLHERCGLNFRDISKLMHYKGPDTTRRFYLRACALRELFTSELPPDIKAAWRYQLLSAFLPMPDPEPDPDPDSPFAS